MALDTAPSPEAAPAAPPAGAVQAPLPHALAAAADENATERSQLAVPRDMQGGDATEASEKEAAAAAAKAAAEAAAAKTTQAAETLQAQAEEERVAGAARLTKAAEAQAEVNAAAHLARAKAVAAAAQAADSKPRRVGGKRRREHASDPVLADPAAHPLKAADRLPGHTQAKDVLSSSSNLLAIGTGSSCTVATRSGGVRKPQRASVSSPTPPPRRSELKMKLRAIDRPRVPEPKVGDKLTVWYQSQGKVTAWRGAVMRTRREGAKMLVRFDAMPPHHADKELWIDDDDEWALGRHWRQRPTDAQIVEACAKARAAAAASAPQKTTPFDLAPDLEPPRCYVIASSGRAWPPPFTAALDELARIHEIMAQVGWVPSESASRSRYVDALDQKGMTGLVNAAIDLLQRIPRSQWRPSKRSWNVASGGAWSQPLGIAHTPAVLERALAAARHQVVKWPASGLVAVAAIANDSEPLAANAAAKNARVLVVATDGDGAETKPGKTTGPRGSCCFVCCDPGADATLPHPRLAGHVLCDTCGYRYQRSVRTVDSELLELHCVACGLPDGAVHGCWTCGGSLCERCLFILRGADGLFAARSQRLDCTVCPGCNGRDDPNPDPDSEDAAYVLCCDSCKQEWHPRCHIPPISGAIGGTSARWTCFHCAVSGPPKTPAWSIHACGACHAVRLDGRLQHLALAAEDVRPFDHAAELSALNGRIDLANAAQRASHWFLDEATLARLAVDGAARNGLTVVSVCDGKGTLLGILLGAGVRVRRYVSVECDEHARRVCRAHYGGGGGGEHHNLAPDALRFVSDAAALSVAQLRGCDAWPVHLLAGSTPCDDISGCNERAAQLGMHAVHSRLLYDFVALFRALVADGGNDGVPVALLYENVVPATTRDRLALRSAFDGLPVLESEGAVFEAARRPRSLVTNFAFARVPEDTKNVRLQDVLNPGAVALADKAGCIIGGTLSALGETVATSRAHSHRNRGRELVLCSASGTDVRGLHVSELAKALGQPYHAVDAAGGSEQLRAGLLGRSFAVGQIRHALGTLIRACACEP